MSRYSMNFYPKKDNPIWDDKYILRKIAPYDDSEYYWAYTYDKKTWYVVFERKRLHTFDNKSENEMIDILEGYNRNIKQRICHN